MHLTASWKALIDSSEAFEADMGLFGITSAFHVLDAIDPEFHHAFFELVFSAMREDGIMLLRFNSAFAGTNSITSEKRALLSDEKRTMGQWRLPVAYVRKLAEDHGFVVIYHNLFDF